MQILEGTLLLCAHVMALQTMTLNGVLRLNKDVYSFFESSARYLQL